MDEEARHELPGVHEDTRKWTTPLLVALAGVFASACRHELRGRFTVAGYAILGWTGAAWN